MGENEIEKKESLETCAYCKLCEIELTQEEIEQGFYECPNCSRNNLIIPESKLPIDDILMNEFFANDSYFEARLSRKNF